MPLIDPSVEEQTLRHFGYDPKDYTIDDNDNIVSRPKGVQPTSGNNIAVQTDVPKEKSSVLGTMGRTAATEAVPATAGWAAGMAAAGNPATLALTAEAAPFIGPFAAGIPLVAGLAGGFGGQYLTHKAQDEVLKRVAPTLKAEMDQQALIDQQEHPIAQAGGALVASMIGGRPSLKSVKDVMSGVRKLPDALLHGAKLSQEQIGAIANAGIGAAIPTGEAIYHNVNEGRPIDPITLALQIAGNAAMVPRGFVGGHPDLPNTVSGRSIPYNDKGATIKYPANEYRRTAPSIDSPEFVGPTVTEPERLRMQGELEAKALADQQAAISKQRQLEFEAAKQELHNAQIKEILSDIQQVKEQTEIKQKIASSNAIKYARVAQDLNAPTSAELYSRYGSASKIPFERSNAEVKAESQADLEARRLEGKRDRYQPENQIDEEDIAIKPTAPATESTIPKEGGPKKPSKEESFVTPNPKQPLVDTGIAQGTERFFRQLGQERQVEVNTIPDRIRNESGQPQKGVSYVDEMGKRIADINSTTPDTYLHELFHHFWDDIKATQPKIAERISKQIENSPEYGQWKQAKSAKGYPADVEEFLADNVGKSTIEKLTNAKSEGVFKDAWSSIKARFGGKPQDIVDTLSRRLRYDAPSHEWVVPTGNVLNPVDPSKQQPDEDIGAVKVFDWDLGGDKPLEMYNLKKPIIDKETGQELHPVNSTVSRETLNKYGVKYQPDEQQELELKPKETPFDKMRKVVATTPEATPQAGVKPARQEANINRQDRSMEKAVRTYSPEEDVDTGPFKSTGENETDTTKHGFLEAMAPVFDKVRKLDVGVSEALKNWETRKAQYLGEWRNMLLRDLKGHNAEDINTVIQHRREKFRSGESDIQLSPEQETINSRIGEVMDNVRDEQRKLGFKIHGRNAGKNPNYIPDMFDDKTIDIFKRAPTSVAARVAKKEWLDYLVENKVDPEDARTMINDYVNAIGAQKKGTTDFGALRKPMGFGLPESLREHDGVKLLRKYAERASSDMAFFRELENNPQVAPKLLNRTDSNYLGGEPDVQNAMKFVYGDFQYMNPKVTAASRLVTNLMLGVKTGLTDTLSIPSLAATYFKRPSDVMSYFTALGNLKDAREASLKTNARSGRLDMLAWHNVESPDRSVTLFNKLAEAARKWQGRDLLEQGNRIYTFAIGKELAKQNYYHLLNGDEGAAEFMEKFGRLTDVEAMKAGNLSEEELNASFDQIAKNFVDRNQGTYAGSGLPSGIMEGVAAPFFTLAKWNIEKSNTVWQDVIKPAQRGDIKPLLAYSASTMLTAAAIQQLAQLLTGKKPQDATISEAIADNNKEQLIAATINLAQVGSLGGIISDAAKIGSDVFIQHQKPQSLAKFPLYDLATSMEQELAMISEAVADGTITPFDAVETFVKRLALNNVQNARIIMNNMVPSQREKIAKQNKFRDARVFKKLEGENVPDTRDIQTNEYSNPNMRKFKQTKDLEEAAKLASELIGVAVKRAHDPIELENEFQKLKRNSYQTMPDPTNDPIKFGKFYKWLVKTEGQQEADKRVQDYFEQRQINQMKSSMIP